MITSYPEKDSYKIKEILSSKLPMKNDNLLITNGSLEGINILISSLVQNNIGYLTPTFWGYGDGARRFNKSIISSPMSDIYKYDIREIDRVSKSCEFMVICNPNNPTTATLTRNEIEEVISNNPQIYFLIDESMLPYKFNFLNYTMLPLVEKYTNLIICSSISKSFALLESELDIFVPTGIL